MSIEYCYECGRNRDTDYEPECETCFDNQSLGEEEERIYLMERNGRLMTDCIGSLAREGGEDVTSEQGDC